MGLTYTNYELNEAAVEAVSAAVQEYMRGLNAERTNVQRVRLTVEEILLNVMEAKGKGLQVRVGLGKQLGRHVLRLRYEGDSFDPTAEGEDAWSGDLLKSLGMSPAWSYKGRANTVSLVLADRAKRTTVQILLIAVSLAVIFGFLGRLCPQSLLREIDEALLSPVADAILGLMSTFAGLVIAFTICSGILGVGDAATFGKLGKQILLRFVSVVFLVCAVSAAANCLILGVDISSGTSGGASGMSEVSRTIFAILPSDPIEPFRTGNTLQIMVIAVFIGAGILAVGERASRLRDLINEGTTLLQHLMTAVVSLVPVYVVATLVRIIWFDDIAKLLVIWKPVATHLAITIPMIAVFTLWGALRLGCGPVRLFKTVFPGAFVAYTTASSMAALPLCMDICEKKIGIDRSVVHFAYPLGSVILMLSSANYLCSLSFGSAQAYGVDISISWIILAIITAALLSIAIPPLPGAALMMYSILFSRLGIPAEAMLIAVAAEVLIDFIDTGSNVLLLLLRLSTDAGALGKVDRSVLSKIRS